MNEKRNNQSPVMEFEKYTREVLFTTLVTAKLVLERTKQELKDLVREGGFREIHKNRQCSRTIDGC